MEKQTLTLEAKALEGVVINGQNVKGYVTSDEVYKSLRTPEMAGNFGRCVFSQCNYSRG
jgi:hypothetical protein